MHPLVDLKVPEGSVAVHWFEQSSFALKDSAGTIVQIDPYFPRERPADRFIHTEPPLDESALPTDFRSLDPCAWRSHLLRIHTKDLGRPRTQQSLLDLRRVPAKSRQKQMSRQRTYQRFAPGESATLKGPYRTCRLRQTP